MAKKQQLGKAYVQIVPSADGIGKSIHDVINGNASPAGESAGKAIASKIKGVLAAAAIGETLRQSIMQGAALEQSLGGVETLFKEHADTVIKNADKAYKTAGLSANAYMETATSFAASLLQSVSGDTKKAADLTDMAIADMSDNANKMGTDMQRIQDAYQGFAKQNYTMLDNLKLGYGGTKTEMERLLADAQKISGIKYDINNLSDVYSAIHVIQEELGVTGTTAKEAEETLTGSFNAMKGAAQSFLGNLVLGRDVEESMKNLVDSASVFLINNLIPASGNIIKSLPTIIEEGIESITSTVEANYPSMVKAGIEFLGEFVSGMLISTPKAIESIIDLCFNILKSIIGYIPKVVEAGVQMITDFGKGLGGAALNQVKTSMANVKSAVLSPINAARDGIKAAIDKIKSYFNITLKFNGIKLPHIDISWNTKGAIAEAAKLLGLKGVPNFNVNWYAEGGIFDSPSIIGLGEAGTEAVVPLDSLWNKMDQFIHDNMNQKNSIGAYQITEVQLRRMIEDALSRISVELCSAMSNVSIEHITKLDGRTVARELTPFIDTNLGRKAVLAERNL